MKEEKTFCVDEPLSGDKKRNIKELDQVAKAILQDTYDHAEGYIRHWVANTLKKKPNKFLKKNKQARLARLDLN
ncbi:MAG: hypothetical protein AAF403_07815 [Pseudomonadota bacterium]